MYGELVITCVTSEGCECDAVTFSADNPRHLMLLRAHVSRKAAGKGRAVLEGVGLAAEKIRLCYVNNPSNEEEAVQQGLMDWSSGQGMQPPTWTVLMGAMEHALIGIQHIRSLKADLGIDEGMLSTYL